MVLHPESELCRQAVLVLSGEAGQGDTSVQLFSMLAHSLHSCLCFSPGLKAETLEIFLLFFTCPLQSKQ